MDAASRLGAGRAKIGSATWAVKWQPGGPLDEVFRGILVEWGLAGFSQRGKALKNNGQIRPYLSASRHSRGAPDTDSA